MMTHTHLGRLHGRRRKAVRHRCCCLLLAAGAAAADALPFKNPLLLCVDGVDGLEGLCVIEGELIVFGLEGGKRISCSAISATLRARPRRARGSSTRPTPDRLQASFKSFFLPAFDQIQKVQSAVC